MGELPIFTCQAHVFTINPQTKKSWIPSSTKAVDVNFFYDSNKHCYRIISVEDSPGGKKVIINSTLTEKMTFKKTSQKFGQWADSKTGGVHGLGFNSEAELTEFVNHFKQYVEATKGSPCTSSSSNGRSSDHIHPMINNSSIGGGGGSGTLCTTQGGAQLLSPMGLSAVSSMNSITHTTLQAPPPPPSLYSVSNVSTASDGSPQPIYPPQNSLQLQQQLRQAQAQVQRLEAEINASKRQINAVGALPGPYPTTELNPIGTDPVHLGGRTPGSADLDSSELRDCFSKLDLNGTCGGLGEDGLLSKPNGISSGTNARGFWVDRSAEESIRSLHTRLGFVLREAVELHARLGLLLVPNTPGGPLK